MVTAWVIVMVAPIEWLLFITYANGQQMGPTPTYRPGPQCGVPNVLKHHAANPFPEKYVGKYYGYRTVDVNVNSVLTITNIGRTRDQLTDEFTVDKYLNIVANEPDTLKCAFSLWAGQATTGGTLRGQYWSSEQSFPTPDAYFVLYMDYDDLVFIHGCHTPNQTTGTCDFPVLLSYTRVPWNQVDSACLSRWDRIINGILAPYCKKASDLNLPAQGLRAPLCPVPQPYESTKAVIQGFRVSSSQ